MTEKEKTLPATEVVEAHAPRHELVVSSSMDLEPTTMKEAIELAEHLANSEIVPKDFRGKPDTCLTAIMMGKEVGLKTMQALQNICVINGRPSLWGDAVLALVKGHPTFEYIDEQFSEDRNTAFCKVKLLGQDPVERQFSMDDAKRAKLASKPGPWQEYPYRMLQMRARSWALRDAAPHILKGIGVADEVSDMSVRVYAGETVVDEVPPQRTALEQAKEKAAKSPEKPAEKKPAKTTKKKEAKKETAEPEAKDTEFLVFGKALEEASSIQQLDDIAAQIRDSFSLKDGERESLRNVYREARAKFESAPPSSNEDAGEPQQPLV